MSTKIQWTQETWNPVVGCTKVSDGCKHCYAITMANRLAHIPAMAELYMDTVTTGASGKANWTGVVKVAEGNMDKPFRFKKPTMFFVNSMSDLFHESVPFDVVDRVFAIMALCPQHTFQVLTKRPERMLEYFNQGTGGQIAWHANNIDAEKWSKVDRYNWPYPNVWLGTSVENQETADKRIPLLLQVPAAVRFLSCEPLLGSIDLFLGTSERRGNIHWVIVGGESGTGSRPMHPDWVRHLCSQVVGNYVPFFFKQWGDWKQVADPTGKPISGVFTKISETVVMQRVGKSKAGNRIDSVVYEQWPVSK